MKLTATVTNPDALSASLERTIVYVRREATRWLEEDAYKIMYDSLNLVPEDTGALSSSAYIKIIDEGDVEFGYGGENVQINPRNGLPSTHYAMEVHENLHVAHQPGKSAKFLAIPVEMHRGRIMKETARKLTRALKEAQKRGDEGERITPGSKPVGRSRGSTGDRQRRVR